MPVAAVPVSQFPELPGNKYNGNPVMCVPGYICYPKLLPTTFLSKWFRCVKKFLLYVLGALVFVENSFGFLSTIAKWIQRTQQHGFCSWNLLRANSDTNNFMTFLNNSTWVGTGLVYWNYSNKVTKFRKSLINWLWSHNK